jgi:hypothetical protein
MKALEFITGHVIHNPAYAYKFQLKTTLEINYLDKKYYYLSIFFSKNPVALFPVSTKKIVSIMGTIQWYVDTSMQGMVTRVVGFSNGGYKISFLPKNQHTQRKLLNFEFLD